MYVGNGASIPSPFLQCITTLSPFFTVVTPGPISSTIPQPSCPNKCGKNFSFPFNPEISCSCAPHKPLTKIFTKTCPTCKSVVSTSEIVRGLSISVRIDALNFISKIYEIKN